MADVVTDQHLLGRTKSSIRMQMARRYGRFDCRVVFLEKLFGFLAHHFFGSSFAAVDGAQQFFA